MSELEALFSLEGKVALVTGGSRGIGYLIAKGLLQAGARVYICGRKAEAIEAAASELGAFGECTAVTGDVGRTDGRAALVAALQLRENRLNVLVNNAGTTWGSEFATYPEEGFEKVMNLNLKAVFHLTQSLLPLLEAAGSQEDPARVINIGSVEGIGIPPWENYAYPASKAAVHHLTRHLAANLARRSITVNAIAPGFFESRMTRFLFEPGTIEDVLDAIPLGRPGTYEDIAGAAVYLASRAGAWVTGIVLPVAGGSVTATASRRSEIEKEGVPSA